MCVCVCVCVCVVGTGAERQNTYLMQGQDGLTHGHLCLPGWSSDWSEQPTCTHIQTGSMVKLAGRMCASEFTLDLQLCCAVWQA